MSTLTRTPLRRRSDAKRRAQAERIALAHQYLAEGRDQCEIQAWLRLAWWSWSMAEHGLGTMRALETQIRVCSGSRIGGLHERRKRSAGGSLTNRQNLIPACNSCNQWVENYPLEARLIGLVVRAGDDEWEELAA